MPFKYLITERRAKETATDRHDRTFVKHAGVDTHATGLRVNGAAAGDKDDD